MTEFFRVRDKDTGHEFTDGFFDPAIHVLVDEPATDPTGAPLPPKPHLEATDDDGHPLRGQALTDALDAAGLSTSGTADERRERLAEHNASTEV